MDYIPNDGGALPPGAPGVVPANLLAGFAALPAAERAAFRAAIAPTHHFVGAPETVYTDLPDAVAGDLATVRGWPDYVYLLKTNTPGTPASWINMFTNLGPPES